MKKINKTVTLVAVVCTMLVILSNTTLACKRTKVDSTDSVLPSARGGGIVSTNIDTNVFQPDPEPTPKKFTDTANTIIGVIRIIGTIISVGALAVIGIKYMIGGVEEKAEYKKTMLPYVIGAVILFAASNLVQVIYSVINKIN